MTKDNMSTAQAIAESFKINVKNCPFDKITVQMISDEAGISRQTFYNYFQDKNDVFGGILDMELIDSLYKLLEDRDYQGAYERIFDYFEENRDFYYYAFKTTGQNSFQEILAEKLLDLFVYILDSENVQVNSNVDTIDNEVIAKFYLLGLVYLLKTWIGKSSMKKYSSYEIKETYSYLVSKSFTEIFKS